MNNDTAAEQATFVRGLYERLEDGNLAGFLSALPQDVEWRLCHPRRELRAHGREEVAAYFQQAITEDHVQGPLLLEYVASDRDIVFAIHAESVGLPGEHRHVLIMRFEDGAPKTIWELTLGGPVNDSGQTVNMFQDRA